MLIIPMAKPSTAPIRRPTEFVPNPRSTRCPNSGGITNINATVETREAHSMPIARFERGS
jgi:hypothetical protein